MYKKLFLTTTILFLFFQHWATEKTTTDILILYPHFFKNTRTLIGKVDSIFSKSDKSEMFVFISNEYNTLFFTGEAIFPEVKRKLSIMAGNLVPDYKFDQKAILKNPDYQALLEKSENVSFTYHFFIPAGYWEHWEENKKKDISSIAYEFGIIPKKLIQRNKVSAVSIYLPKGQDTDFNIQLRGIEAIQKTL